MNRPEEKIVILANWINRNGLREPVLFLLESHRPLSGMLQHLSHFTFPLFGKTFGKEYVDLFADQKNIDRLILLLDETWNMPPQ